MNDDARALRLEVLGCVPCADAGLMCDMHATRWNALTATAQPAAIRSLMERPREPSLNSIGHFKGPMTETEYQMRSVDVAAVARRHVPHMKDGVLNEGRALDAAEDAIREVSTAAPAPGKTAHGPYGRHKDLVKVGRACLDWVKDTGDCHFCDFRQNRRHEDGCPLEFANDAAAPGKTTIPGAHEVSPGIHVGDRSTSVFARDGGKAETAGDAPEPWPPCPYGMTGELHDQQCTRCYMWRGSDAGELYQARAQRDRLRAELASTAEEWDATDGAHPCWWRGHDNGSKGAEKAIAKLRAELAEARRAEDSDKLAQKALQRVRDHWRDRAERAEAEANKAREGWAHAAEKCCDANARADAAEAALAVSVKREDVARKLLRKALGYVPHSEYSGLRDAMQEWLSAPAARDLATMDGTAETRPYPCGVMVGNDPNARCSKESDHDGDCDFGNECGGKCARIVDDYECGASCIKPRSHSGGSLLCRCHAHRPVSAAPAGKGTLP